MITSDSFESQNHRSALAEPRFLRYFISSCFSTVGIWLIRFLLGWIAWETTHSALWVGVVAGALMFPSIILSPIFGIISDRINPRNGLLVTVSTHVLLACIAGVTYLLEWYSLPWLICLTIVFGIVASAHTPIRLSLVPRLVWREALPSAIGYSAITFNTSRILGPAIGTGIITSASVAVAFFAAMILFVVALGFLLTVKNVNAMERKKKSRLSQELIAGLVYVKQHRGIRLVLSFTLINGLLGRTVIELLPALSGQLLNGDSNTLAILTGGAGAGSILGSLVVSRQQGNEPRLLNMVMGSLLLGVLLLFTVRWLDGLAALGALIACLSMVTTIVGTCSQALAQLLVIDEYRGRVMSLWAVLALGTPALGTLGMGLLVDFLGFPNVLTIFALLAIPAIVFLLRRKDWLG